MLIAIISCYVLMFGIKKSRNYEILTGDKKQQTIFTVWHLETFEGGGKARIDFLKNIARTIEKQDESVLFFIKSISPEQLESELKVTTPDIVSFGYGVGKIVLPYLIEQNKTYDVRDELIESGSFNKKLYAIPYIVGGYANFEHSADFKEFHVGQNSYIAPHKIYENMGLSPFEHESQYEAYKDFVNNKKVKLLGTTRDLFRVNNLNNIGRTNAIISPVDTYTDLIQYIGLTNNNSICEKFLSLTLNIENQNSLIDYSLFSSLYHKIYSSGIYSDMEDAIYSCKIPSLFD